MSRFFPLALLLQAIPFLFIISFIYLCRDPNSRNFVTGVNLKQRAAAGRPDITQRLRPVMSDAFLPSLAVLRSNHSLL